MPLSAPVSRKVMHRRSIECIGYQRDDGLWDVEGHLIDTKPFDLPNEDRGGIPAGEPLHEMWIRLTVDVDLVVRNVEARTDHGPYSICGDISGNFKALTGLVIKPGWTLETRNKVGGVKGCTHLVELLGPIATTAFQTIYPARARREESNPSARKPALLGTCHAYAPDSEIVKRRWPQFYTGADR